ncbi:hypothetical protein HK102_004128, partial [Quaeritorhiza haematococci]
NFDPHDDEVVTTRDTSLPHILRRDHKQITHLYNSYLDHKESGASARGGKAEEQRTKDVDRMLKRLVGRMCQHLYAEEWVFFTEVERLGVSSEMTMSRLKVTHQNLKHMLDTAAEAIEKGDVSKGEEILANVVPVDEVRQEEECELAKFESIVPEHEQESLARKYMMLRRVAPTRPHPWIPEEPQLLELAAAIAIAPPAKLYDFTESILKLRE